MYGIPHGRGANLLMWRSDKVKGAANSWSAVFDRAQLAEQGQGHGLRQPDLHRRRGAVPEGAPARPEDHEPLRARRQAVQRGGRPAQEAAREHRRVLVGLHQGAGGVRQRQLDGRHDLAGHREPARGRQGAGQDDAAEGGRDRLVGHLDDLVEGQAPELHVQVDELHHLAEGATPQVAEWFGEAPSNAKACAQTAVKNHCKIFHADDEAVLRRASSFWTTPRKELRRRPRRRSARTTPSGSRPGRRSRADALTAVRAVPGGRWAAGSPTSCTAAAAAARAAAAGAAGLAGHRLPRARWRSCSSRRSGTSTRSAARSCTRYSTARTSRRCGTSTSTARSSLRTVGDRRGGDGHRRAARVPDRVLHGEGRDAAGARRCWSSRC